jgi:hypothetical protein
MLQRDSRGHQKLTGHRRAPLALLGAPRRRMSGSRRWCSEPRGRGQGRRASSYPRSQKRERCEPRHIRRAAIDVSLTQERRAIAQCVGAKSYQGLTQPADRSLNPDAPRGDQRVNGAAEKANEPNGQRHDHGNDHGSDACCLRPPGSRARCRHRRPLSSPGQSFVRPLSAGAALHARPRTKVACQA